MGAFCSPASAPLRPPPRASEGDGVPRPAFRPIFRPSRRTVKALLKRLVPARLRERLRLEALRGDVVHCPVCGQGAIAFLPAGTPPRPHARCAFCGSLERTRAIWRLLQQRGLLKPGQRILHIAPEGSLHTRLLAQAHGTDYVFGDKFEPGYDHPAGTVELDVTALELPDAAFDLVLCVHVLEHVTADRQALRELHRVLKPGGTALLVVPFDPARAQTFEDPTVTDPQERLRLFGQFDHVRIYGRDYPDRLREAGFTVEEVDPCAGLGPEEVFRLGLKRGEVLHVVGR